MRGDDGEHSGTLEKGAADLKLAFLLTENSSRDPCRYPRFHGVYEAIEHHAMWGGGGGVKILLKGMCSIGNVGKTASTSVLTLF